MNETRETRDYLVRQFTLQAGRRGRLLQDRQTLLSTGDLTRDEWRAEFNRLNAVVRFLREQIRTIEEYIRPN